MNTAVVVELQSVAKNSILGGGSRVENELLANLDKLHTTELGVERVKRNLNLSDTDVVAWCKDKTKNSSNIVRRGKNWYVHTEDAVITVNAHSFTIITAHKAKKKMST